MSRLFRRTIHLLRGERGQAGLEGIIVFPIWLVVTTLFVNMLFFLGTAMVVQADINRAALHASSLGCFSDDVAANLSDHSGFGMQNFSVAARTTTGKPPRPDNSDATYYRLDHGAFFDGNGELNRGADASRCGRNAVPNGKWIAIQATYDQNLWVFGQQEVRRNALVISHTLQDR